jgi:hypothetical protein
MLQMVLLTVAVLAIAMGAMAIGVMITGRRLKGSCGGVGGADCACEQQGIPRADRRCRPLAPLHDAT